MRNPDLLTRRQREVYEFIRSKIQKEFISPSHQDIASEFGITRTAAGVFVKAISRKGFLRYIPNVSRSITLVDTSSKRIPSRFISQSDFSEWTRSFNTFAVQMKGDAMIDAHIKDGDFAIIDSDRVAAQGQIVAFEDTDEEILLRKYYQEKNNQFRMEPANSQYKALHRDQVTILGVLIGVVHQY